MNDGLDLGYRFDPVDRETWAERVEADLKGGSLDSLRTRVDGLDVDPLYDASADPAPRGVPGAAPFVRGRRAAPGWRLVEPLEGADAQALVDAARRARDGGADAVLLDEAAMARLDVEAIHAIGGPAILDPGADALAWLPVATRVDGVALRFDPYGALARRGGLPYDLDRAHRWLGELATEGRRIWVDATLHHHAGATAPEEVAIAAATGVAYLRALAALGHPLADAPARLGFSLACDADVFLSAAKLRAARWIWSKVLRATGIDDPAHGMVVHAFESRRPATVLEPLVGALRGTAAALGAVVGGADELSLAPHAPTPAAARLARNTQHMLRHEAHLDRVRDPGGGAHYLEALTDVLARAAWGVFQQLEREGGLAAQLESGALAQRLAASAARRAEAIAHRRPGLVGISRYASADDPEAGVAPTPAGPAVSSERAPEAIRRALDEATRGELAAALIANAPPVEVLRHELRRGAGAEVEPLIPVRDAAPFEALRRRAAALDAPRREALVLGVGPVRQVQPRVEFAREALGIAGLRVTAPEVTESLDAVDDPPPTVVLCTTEPLAPLVQKARAAGATQVLVAGPDEEGSGVDGRLHRDMDAVSTLGAVLAALEEVSS